MPVITTFRYREVIYDAISGLLLQKQPHASTLFKSIAYPFEQGIVVTNDDGAACTGDSRSFRAPRAFTLREVRASLVTAPSGGPLRLDVECNGTSLFTGSAVVRIDSGENTSTTSSVPAVLATTDIPNDALLEINVLECGDEGVAAGLKVFFIGSHQV